MNYKIILLSLVITSIITNCFGQTRPNPEKPAIKTDPNTIRVKTPAKLMPKPEAKDSVKTVITGRPATKVRSNLTVSPITTETVKLEDINEWLCPSRLERGDREFDGHGPRIKSEVKLRIGRDSVTLWADITFSAVETVHDWSTTSGRWSKLVYEAPYGKKIMAIMSDKASRTQFISPPGGFQFLVPGADVSKVLYEFLDKTDIKSAVLKAFGYGPNEKSALSALVKGSIDNGNTVVQVPPVEGTLVKFFHIVGDTGGPDISHDDNCNDDTRIVKIEFFPAKLKLRTAQN